MGIESLLSYAGTVSGGFDRDAQAVRLRNQQRVVVDPCSDEPLRVRQRRGHGTREYDFVHAVLVIREAPRVGSVLTGSSDPLRRYLESINLRQREPLGRIVYATDHFLVDFFQETDSERYTPVYNFGTSTVHTNSRSGRQPRMYQYGGQLLSSEVEGSAFSAFQVSWDNWLRVTRNVTGSERHDLPFVVELTYRDQIRRGYLVSMNQGSQSLIPGQSQFAFTMFVIHEAARTPNRPVALQEVSGFRQLSSESVPIETTDPQIVRPSVEDF